MGSMFPIIQCYFAWGDIQNESHLNPSLAKPRQNAKVNLKTDQMFNYGDIHYSTNSFLKMTKNSHPTSLHYALHSLHFFIVSGYFYYIWYTQKCADKIVHMMMHILILLHYHVFIFMLPKSRPNFAKLPTPHNSWAGLFMCTTPVGMTNRTFWTWSRWCTEQKLWLQTM